MSDAATFFPLFQLPSKEGREGKKGARKQDGDEEETKVVGFVLGVRRSSEINDKYL